MPCCLRKNKNVKETEMPSYGRGCSQQQDMEASSDGPFSRRRAEQRDLHSSFQILVFNLGIASREQATDAGIEQGYSGHSASTDQVGQSTWERSLDAWTELELGPPDSPGRVW